MTKSTARAPVGRRVPAAGSRFSLGRTSCPDEGARHPWRACRDPRPPGHSSPRRSHRRFLLRCKEHVGGVTPTALDHCLPKKPRQRIAEAASRPGDAESRRSEESRVGKECVSTCGSRGWTAHYNKKRNKNKR